jgi:putative addiction module killer protein
VLRVVGLAGRLTSGHFPGQSRLFSLLGLRVGAAPGLAKSTTYARRFIVNQGDRSSFERCRSLVLVQWEPLRYHLVHELPDQRTAAGRWRQPFREWFGSLEAVAAAKVRVAVSRMEQGNLSNVEWFHGIGEYKIDWGPGLRIYLAKDGLKIIILIGGGTKKRQQQDIDQAVALWEDYKRRKASTSKGAK